LISLVQYATHLAPIRLDRHGLFAQARHDLVQARHLLFLLARVYELLHREHAVGISDCARKYLVLTFAGG
jgi:hypothetical protein